ncbi:hypothetical protein HID58_005138 [Brassica napus]|uniref:Uncharacterized protein n=1 Tax=Brassica napus TaxID=3708 RepID=A0ABQ8E7R5_BRANA|nr:uncharacterized protein LOC106418561 [Brassica napus]KAH0937677.1 hypothetical protein HID58_005138 [Brassica napus]
MGGGGRVMATAAKVAGIGVAKGGFRGGLGVPAAANDQFNVRTTSVSKPVSASLSSAFHPSAETDAMVLQRVSWEDDWEFAEVETTTTTTIPRVVFSKPPSLEEAKEATDDLKDAINLVYTEGSNEAGSVSRMLSSFHLSDKRAVESAVPQVALNAFAFLSESSAAQSVVASIASDPKVWDAVMENNDLVKFLNTNTTAASTQVEATDTDDKAEDSSETESEEDSEAKLIQLLEILEDMKLKAVQLMENVSSYFGGLFRLESFTENGEERKRTLLNDPTSLFGLAVCVIFMVVMKRA